jgi:cobaltochelatase CobN
VAGLRFGNVCLLLQPERGYDRDPSLNYHCPDLAPPHADLARYLRLRQEAQVQLVCHVGKHGNLEWLPGKGLGLSASCFPEWALGPMPHLYPFIVNDPGEGSQAKRRSQAVILDHLTPPLGRAGLHGPLLALEALLDEYWQASELGAERTGQLQAQVLERLSQLQLGPELGPELGPGQDPAETEAPEGASSHGETLLKRLQAADGDLLRAQGSPDPYGLALRSANCQRPGPWRNCCCAWPGRRWMKAPA